MPRNRIKCAGCGEVIESKSVHDFRTCRCGKVSVDGGQEYSRYVGSLEDIIVVHDDGSEEKFQLKEW